VTEIFTAPGCAPFSVALLVMLGLAALELVMVLTGLSVNDLVDDLVAPHVDVHADVDLHGHLGVPHVDAPTGMETTHAVEGDASAFGKFLAWLYVGRVPVLMIVVVFLTVFGLGGILLQGVLRAVAGLTAPAIVATPVMIVLSLPMVRVTAGVLARLMPRDESSAVDPETFVGRTATVTGGTARDGLPAQARLTDEFGTTHYVLAEPDESGDVLRQGEVVLLVRRISGSRFAAIHNPNEALVDRE
jgi:hypothetical protein